MCTLDFGVNCLFKQKKRSNQPDITLKLTNGGFQERKRIKYNEIQQSHASCFPLLPVFMLS